MKTIFLMIFVAVSFSRAAQASSDPVLEKTQFKLIEMMRSGQCKGIYLDVNCGPSFEACTEISQILRRPNLESGLRSLGLVVRPFYSYQMQLNMYYNGGKRGNRPRPPKRTVLYTNPEHMKCASEIESLVSIIAPAVLGQALGAIPVYSMEGSLYTIHPKTVYLDWYDHGGSERLR